MSGWRNVGRIHTVPVNDLAEHSLCADCACGPRIESPGEDEDGVQQIVHNAFDGRDFSEKRGSVSVIGGAKVGRFFVSEGT